MAPMPQGAEEGIIKGIYLFRPASKKEKFHVQLWGSSAILREALRAQEILRDQFKISSDVWSVTSYQLLRKDALDAARWNMWHPQDPPKVPYLQKILKGVEGPFIAASDSVRAVPDQVSRWVPGSLYSLGTDGFGRSDTREGLRRFFEVDAETMTIAALHRLSVEKKFPPEKIQEAIKKLGLNPEKPNPANS
jgi:pyruvate dehydrogenase E1 component